MSVMSSTGLFTRADIEALPDDGLRHELIAGAIFINPAPNWEFTREDYDSWPTGDGIRRELLFGAMVMTPAPGLRHQDMVAALYLLLVQAVRGTDLHVVLAPYSVSLCGSIVEPDLVVARRADFTERDIHVPPVLVVEVRSPGSHKLDTVSKRALYESAGVANSWLVDPMTPAIEVLTLVDGHYLATAVAAGSQMVVLATPFAITLCPAELLLEPGAQN